MGITNISGYIIFFLTLFHFDYPNSVHYLHEMFSLNIISEIFFFYQHEDLMQTPLCPRNKELRKLFPTFTARAIKSTECPSESNTTSEKRIVSMTPLPPTPQKTPNHSGHKSIENIHGIKVPGTHRSEPEEINETMRR